MEKGPSTYAEYWTSPYAEVNHFYYHAYDMGYTYITEYSQAAINFANSKDDNKSGLLQHMDLSSIQHK